LKKELREQIKENEFASGVDQVLGWAAAHRDEVRIGAGVVVVLLAAAGALGYFQSQRHREADRAFRDALTTFEAPVTAELAPNADRPTGHVFASAEDRYKTAAAAFEGVERRYGSAMVGVRAKYFAALARIELKQYVEAEKVLKEIQARAGGALEAELARSALAGLYGRTGQVDKAVETYRGLATNPSANLPRDSALMAAARTLDGAKRWSEARAVYRELLEEFPASVYAGEARARADYLETAPRS
jgi:tetratricopeptide (TPR) repeat protein